MDPIGFIVRNLTHDAYLRRDGLAVRTYRSPLRSSQFMSVDELADLQLGRLSAVLMHAYQHVPFYRKRFDKVGFHPTRFRRFADLAELPVLTKDDVRQNNLFAEGFTPANTLHKRTGGSTGVPVHVYMDRPAASAKYAATERHNGWAGWRPGDRVAALWGNTTSALPLRARLRNTLTARTRCLDTLHISEEALANFLARIRREKPPILFGHAHSIYVLAEYAMSLGVRHRFRSIVTTAMTLSREERSRIESAFLSPVFNRYGCEELSIIASECDRHAGLHIFAEGLFIEMCSNNAAEPSPIIITDLFNRAMPLIRYEIGDMAVSDSARCPCGRTLPLLTEVSGRVADFLYRPDGSRVFGISILDTFVIHIPGIRQLQMIQDALDHMLVRLVPSPDYSDDTLSAFARTVREVFGPSMTWSVELVPKIESTPGGKYRFSICRIPGFADADVQRAT